MVLSDKHLISEAARIAAELPSLNREIETKRNIPNTIVDRLKKAGIFHALVPKEYGGAETHPLSVIEIIKQISKGRCCGGLERNDRNNHWTPCGLPE